MSFSDIKGPDNEMSGDNEDKNTHVFIQQRKERYVANYLVG